MAETFEVTIGGQKVRRTLPAGSSEAAIRAAFRDVMRQKGIDSRQQAIIDAPAPQAPPKQSNEQYWRQQLGNQGTISQQRPDDSVRGSLGNLLYQVGKGLGHSNPARLRSDAQGAVDWVPGLGDVAAVGDAQRAFQGGNYGQALQGAALAGIGMVPGVGDAASAGIKKGIRAYHGSPHDFDRFDLGKIGTGEGAQAYGHGLYFAENEDVAQNYRKTLSGPRPDYAPGPEWRQLRDALGPVDYLGFDTPGEAVRAIRNHPDWSHRWEVGQQADQIKPAFDAYEAAKYSGQGRMYEVNINADPNTLLDWDAPNLTSGSGADLSKLSLERDNEKRLAFFRTGQSPWSSEQEALAGFKPTTDLQTLLNHFGSELPDAARSVGIPGIKYLDQGSRGVGQGSRNFVMFDDKLIDIARKYGIALPVAGGATAVAYGAGQPANGEPLAY